MLYIAGDMHIPHGKRVSSSDESICMLKAVANNDKHKNARRKLQKNRRRFCSFVWVMYVF